MSLGRLIASIVALTVVGLGIAAIGNAAETHVYPVELTIEADSASKKIEGAILTDAPSEFCDSSTIRLREAMKGKDRIVARLTPYGGVWRMKAPPALSGKRVYAEVSQYHLPARPVVCLGDRSPSVTAP